MTYNEFKQKLEELVIGYAMECEAEVHVDVKVEVTESRAISGNVCLASSVNYEAKTKTEIG